MGSLPTVASSSQDALRLPMMTWYHPVLEPGLGGIVLLCTVTKVEADEELYGNHRWKVDLRIDEQIHVADHFKERLKKVAALESGDFRKRTVGDRIVVFAGGPEYEGDDFLLPCWSGTSTDLGILLHSPDHPDANANDRLLTQLRAAAKANHDEADFMEAFAEFCPLGVATYFIRKIRMEQLKFEEESALRKATALPFFSVSMTMAFGLSLLTLAVVSWKLMRRRPLTTSAS